MKERCLGWLLLAGLSVGMAEADTTRQERIAEALRAVLIDVASDPANATAEGAAWDFTVTAEPQRVGSFGVVLNPRFDPGVAEAGPMVLAVTPGSNAARVGIRSGDRLRAFNGTALYGLGERDGRSAAFTRFSELVASLEDGTAVHAEVVRSGKPVVLRGEFRALELPGYRLEFTPAEAAASAAAQSDPSGCATVSVQGSPPRDLDIYRAEFQAINGDRSGAALRSTHFLVPGEYTFTLSEEIPDHEVATQMQRFEERRGTGELTLQVEPGMVYQLGARLLVPRNLQEPDTPFWKPVLWKAEPGECRGKPVER